MMEGQVPLKLDAKKAATLELTEVRHMEHALPAAACIPCSMPCQLQHVSYAACLASCSMSAHM